MTIRPLLAAAAALATLAASPAPARTLTFRAQLGGTAPPTVTGSPASGRATVRVDTSARRVSVELEVTGVTRDQLSDDWIKRPGGPVTFNDYRGPEDRDPVAGADWGAAYRATRAGFALSWRGDYAAAAKPFDTGTSFDEFVNALTAGRIVIVVHTDRFGDGEISGRTRAN